MKRIMKRYAKQGRSNKITVRDPKTGLRVTRVVNLYMEKSSAKAS